MNDLKIHPWKFTLGQFIVLRMSNEVGRVVGRAEHVNRADQYLVLYQAGDGRQVKQWWDVDDLVEDDESFDDEPEAES